MRGILAAAGLVLSLLSQQGEKAVIEGVVQTVGTNVPIASAQVSAYPVNSGSPVLATTNAEGRFSLSVDPGQYRLSADRQGFIAPRRQRVDIVPGVLLTVAAGRRYSDARLELNPTGTITGRIFDPDGHVMEGVSVSLMQLTWTGNGRRMLQPVSFGPRASATNDLGEYRIYWIPPGDYYLTARDSMGTVSAPVGFTQRYVTTYYPGVSDAAQAALVTVPAGTELAGMNLTLSRLRATSVRGRLVSPIDVADSVTIINMSALEETFVVDRPSVTFNDHDKTFVAPNVIPGRYRILATLRIPNKFNLSGEVILDVGEDPIQNVTLTVAPSKRITGRLRVEDSSPEVRAAVETGKLHVVLRADPNLAFLSTTGEVDKEGNFIVPDVGMVRFALDVIGLPADAYIASARLGGADILERGFTLRGDPPGPLEVSVSELGGRMVGAVRTPANEIAANVRVVLVPETSLRDRTDLFKTATTDQYGRFNIRGITPGHYKLFAFEDAPFGAYFDSEFLRPYEDQAKQVTVEKNDYIQAELTARQHEGK